MLSFILGAAIGLVVGWNFLPQPLWVKNAVDKMMGRSSL